MPKNVFRREPIGNFVGVIGARKGMLANPRFVSGKSAQVRNPAIATVTGICNSCDGGPTVTLPVDPTTWDGDYKRGNLIKPTPTLKSVVIDYGGEWGCAQRISVEIEAYTRSDFTRIYKAFLLPGNTLEATVKYSAGSNIWTTQDSIRLSDFTIATFEFTATADGTWLCRCTGVSASAALKTTDMQLMMKGGLEYRVAGNLQGEKTSPVRGVAELITHDAQQNGKSSLGDMNDGNVIEGGSFTDFSPGGQYASLKDAATVVYKGEYARTVLDGIVAFMSNVKNSIFTMGDQAESKTYQVYVTLGYVVNRIINDRLMRMFQECVTDSKFKDLKIAFHPEFSKGKVCTGFKSGDPLSVLLLGGPSGNYKNFDGAGKDFNKVSSPSPVMAVGGDGTVDLKKILIHKDVVVSCIESATKVREASADNADVKDTKEETVNIVDFFNAISDAIASATGGFIALRLVEDTGSSDKNVLWVVDQNYGVSDTLPVLKLNPIDGDNVTRTCEVSSNVGSEEYRASMFVGTSKKGDPIASARGCMDKLDYGRANMYSEARQAIAEIVISPGLLGTDLFSPQHIQALRSAVATLYKSRPNATEEETIHFPGLSINATIDGAWGILPGCGITSTQVPPEWEGKGIYFMVRRVVHTIAESDWSTNIEGIMALHPNISTY